MDKIKIWITVDENQMLADYSLAAKENYIEIEDAWIMIGDS